MVILKICNNYEEASTMVEVVAEYIDCPISKHLIPFRLSGGIEDWVNENLEGIVTCFFEYEYNKSFTTFLFQYSEDAIAFKLYWM